MADLRLAVVMLNYKTPELVVQSLASLDGQLVPGKDQVIVVDNDSGDGSPKEIQSAIDANGWGGWATLIESGRNGGFSFGNNVGIAAADAETYLLLNSDTIVRDGAIDAMLEVMGAHPEVGLLGPRLEWPDGKGQISAFRYITPFGQLLAAARLGFLGRLFPKRVVAIELPDSSIEPDWVSFACVLIRREVIKKIGPMDEGYFMYFEDVEYARRARAAGWKVLHDPTAHVVHLRGGTSPVKELARQRRRLPKYFYASRARYFRTQFGWCGLVAANVWWTVGLGLEVLRRLMGRSSVIPSGSWRDVWTGTFERRAVGAREPAHG